MATCDQLARLIRCGLSAEEIIDRLGVKPSRLRQMLGSKGLRWRLSLTEDVAMEVASHRTAGRVGAMTERLVELAYGDKSETARKACMALLAEGIRIMECQAARSGQADQSAEARKRPQPARQEAPENVTDGGRG